MNLVFFILCLISSQIIECTQDQKESSYNLSNILDPSFTSKLTPIYSCKSLSYINRSSQYLILYDTHCNPYQIIPELKRLSISSVYSTSFIRSFFIDNIEFIKLEDNLDPYIYRTYQSNDLDPQSYKRSNILDTSSPYIPENYCAAELEEILSVERCYRVRDKIACLYDIEGCNCNKNCVNRLNDSLCNITFHHSIAYYDNEECHFRLILAKFAKNFKVLNKAETVNAEDNEEECEDCVDEENLVQIVVGIIIGAVIFLTM
jgi:hypothetical protein